MGNYQLNLTKIQSLPVVGEEWRYYMYVDVEFEQADNYRKMLEEIAPLTTELKILGEYQQAPKLS